MIRQGDGVQINYIKSETLPTVTVQETEVSSLSEHINLLGERISI